MQLIKKYSKNEKGEGVKGQSSMDQFAGLATSVENKATGD